MTKSRLVTIGIVIGALIGVASLVALTAWTATGFSTSASKVNSEWKAWQANGLPVTREQVYLAPEPSDAMTVEGLLRQSVARENGVLPQVPKTYEELASFSDGTRRRYLDSQRPRLDLMIKASELNGYQPRTDWDRPSEYRFTGKDGLFDHVGLLTDDAELKAAAGNWREAVREIRATRRLLKFLGQIPSEGTQPWATESDRAVLFIAGRCASLLAENPEAIRALREMLEETAWQSQPIQIVRADLYVQLAAFRSYSDRQIYDFAQSDMDPWQPMRRPQREGLPRSLMSRAVLAEIMAFWNQFYPRMAAPGTDQKRLHAEMNRAAEAYRDSRSVPQQIAFRSIKYDYAYQFEASEDHQTEQRLALAFLRILEHRSLHHTWPPSLEAVSAAGLDTRDGKPLRYKITPSSTRVYSVGTNRRDNGGISQWEKDNGAPTGPGSQTDNAYIHPWPHRPSQPSPWSTR